MRERRRTQSGTVEKAGCIPVRKRPNSSTYEVLLVQSRYTKNVWAFPKGSVEPGETFTTAAVRETLEEAGVIGRITARLGSITPAHNVRLRLLLMHVDEELNSADKRWIERDCRTRSWCSLQHARALITPQQLTQPLDKAIEFLYGSSSSSNMTALSSSLPSIPSTVLMITAPVTATATATTNQREQEQGQEDHKHSARLLHSAPTSPSSPPSPRFNTAASSSFAINSTAKSASRK